jgi:hypothetical protein
MAAIAVSASGVVHLLSATSTGGARQLYRYGADGVLVSKQPISGATTTPGVANLTAPEGMDFAPDGTLYVSQQGAIWRLEPSTGVGTLRATGVNTSGDFDIDATGLLRTVRAGQLNVIRISDWALDSATTVQGAAVAAGALVHR